MDRGFNFVFLDFDGVAHPQNCRAELLFSRLPALVDVIGEYRRARIIISSSWRTYRTLEQIREQFPPQARHLVLDTTPVLRSSGQRGHRGKECAAWIDANAPLSRWMAIDDEPSLFTPDHRLLLCQSRLGYQEQQEAELRSHLVNLSATPKPVRP